MGGVKGRRLTVRQPKPGPLAVQGELFAVGQARTRGELIRTVSSDGRVAVEVTLTRNRVSLATIHFAADGPAQVRLHEAFLAAPADVIDALARYLRRRRRADWLAVSRFARHIEPAGFAGKRPRALCAQGRVYDLDVLRREVNRLFFNGRLTCRITWGKPRAVRRGRKRSASIRYGSWDATHRIVRVHPLLDDARVPAEFVRYIVYHEMLHAVIPSQWNGHRRDDHPAAFRAQERRFPDLERMRRHSRELLKVLL
jgi:hypothetical protein